MLTGSTGSWGSLTLLREVRRPYFSAADVQFVASLLWRRWPTVCAGQPSMAPSTTGRRRQDFSCLPPMTRSRCPTRRRQRGSMSCGSPAPHRCPPAAIWAVVAQARRVAASGDHTGLATARVRTRRGRWAVVRGLPVGTDRVAVLIEAARPSELASAIADLHGFTARAATVTELVARGLPTREISNQLHLSAYTVQDHLKAIFEKSGSSSRAGRARRQVVLRSRLSPEDRARTGLVRMVGLDP